MKSLIVAITCSAVLLMSSTLHATKKTRSGHTPTTRTNKTAHTRKKAPQGLTKNKKILPGKTKESRPNGLRPKKKHHRHRHHYYDSGVVVTSGSENRTDTLKNPDKEAECLAAAKEYKAKAKAARAQGKQKLATSYDQCASAKNQLATGYRLGDRTLIDLANRKLQDALSSIKQ